MLFSPIAPLSNPLSPEVAGPSNVETATFAFG